MIQRLATAVSLSLMVSVAAGEPVETQTQAWKVERLGHPGGGREALPFSVSLPKDWVYHPKHARAFWYSPPDKDQTQPESLYCMLGTQPLDPGGLKEEAGRIRDQLKKVIVCEPRTFGQVEGIYVEQEAGPPGAPVQRILQFVIPFEGSCFILCMSADVEDFGKHKDLFEKVLASVVRAPDEVLAQEEREAAVRHLEEQVDPPRLKACVGHADPEIAAATAVVQKCAVALRYGFDGSSSKFAVVRVEAIRKGHKIALELRFAKQAGRLVLSDSREEDGNSMVEGAGEYVSRVFFRKLFGEMKAANIELARPRG